MTQPDETQSSSGPTFTIRTRSARWPQLAAPRDPDAIADAAAKARKAATPMDNTDFQTQWRGQMVERYVTAALREAAGLDPGIRAPRHRLL